MDSNSWAIESQKKIIQPKHLAATVAKLRPKTIATLNGSFDLLHAGHLHIIFEASKQADLLIVCLNSDASIQQYKSKDRPIIPLKYRLEMMSALGFVDYVTWFDELDPRAILEQIKPDVHVNGAEYGADCIEAETVLSHGGKLHLVGKVEGLSTSAIVKKIGELTCA